MTTARARGPLRLLRLALKLVFALFALAYFTVVRSFLFLLTGYLVVYFLAQTSTVRDLAQGEVSRAIPGTITAATVQWGPSPWEVVITDGRVCGDRGQTVIRAPLILAEVALGTSIGDLVDMLRDPQAPISLHFDSVRVVRPWIWVEVTEEGVNLADAFVAREPDGEEEDGEPTRVNIHVQQAIIEDGHGRVDTEQAAIDVRDLDARGDLHITGEGHLQFSIPRARLTEGDVWLPPTGPEARPYERLLVPVRDLEVSFFEWEGMAYEFKRAEAALGEDRSGRIVARGGMDVEPEVPTWFAGMRVEVPGHLELLPAFTNGLVRGPAVVAARGSGTLEQATARGRLQSPVLEVIGFDLREVLATFEVFPEATPEGERSHRFVLPSFQADAFGGRVIAEGTSYFPRFLPCPEPMEQRTLHEFTAVLELVGVNPWAIFASPFIDAQAAAELEFLRGSLDGLVQVAGVYDDGDGSVTLHGRTEGLTMAWGGAASVPLNERYTVSGGFRYVYVPGPDGQPQLSGMDLDQVRIESGADVVELDGTVDVAAETLDLRANVRVADLAAFLAPFGVTDVGGSLRLSQARIGGTFDNPAVRGNLRWSRARAAGYDLGTIATAVDLANGQLSFGELKLNVPFAQRLEVAGSVRLWHGSVANLDRRVPFTLRRLNVTRLDVGEIAPELGLRAIVDLRSSNLTGYATDPIRSLRGEGVVRATQIAYGGERAREATGRIVFTQRRLVLQDARVVLEGGEEITGTLSMDKQTGAVAARLRTERLPFSAFRFFAANDIDIEGDVTVDLTAEGTLGRPQVIGTVRVTGFRFGPVALGDAELVLAPGEDGRIELSATELPPGLTLLEGSHIQTRGGIPQYIALLIEATDLNLWGLLPGLAVPDVDVVVTGKAALELWPTSTTRLWQLTAEAPVGGVRLALFEGDIVYTNRTPARIVQNSEGLTLDPLVVGDPSGQAPLVLCGNLGEARQDFQITGTLNLELLQTFQVVSDLFSVLQGELRIGADPATARAVAGRCLPDEFGDRVLTVTGTMDAPKVSGRIETVAVRMLPRGFGQEIRLSEGAGVLLRSGRAPGVTEIAIRPDQRIVGEMGDGRFEAWGTMTLDALGLDDADLNLVGTDLYWASPGEYNMTFNAELTARVRDFASDTERVVDLRGDVFITDMTFFRSFDTLGRAFGSITEGTIDTYQDPLTTRVPWLRDLRMNLNVESSVISIRSPFPLGSVNMEARLDLRVEGGIDEPLVYNRIELLPGGTINYRLFDRQQFELVSGALDFNGPPLNPTVQLQAQNEITYFQQVTGGRDLEEKTVIVIISVTGVAPDRLRVDLSSTPGGFDQADLHWLLLTGRPRTSEARAQQEGLLSFNVSNLVDQVIKAPFDYDLAVSPTLEGLLNIELQTRLGRDFTLRYRSVQDTDATRFIAGFTLRITDRLVFEGTVDRSTGNLSTINDTYEVRVKYRIPLE